MKKRILNIKELRIHFLILAISLFMTLPVWGGSLTQLTFDPALDGHPYWSPDGNKIVFHSTRSGNYDVWVMDADGSNQTQLTYNSGDNKRPHWSPCGTKIVFHSNRSGNQDIWVMNADGTNQTNLTKHPAHDTHPNWGPDGTIAFQSNRSNSGTGDVNIWVMDADGSNLHQRTTDPLDDTHPMWSPDGTMMAFARRESETSPADIWVMNADGTNETQITSDPGDEQHADWSPCGTSIAFRSNKADNYDIWVVYLDDLAQNQITTYTGDDRNPDWSPDGTMMAFRSDRSDNNDIWIYYFPITVNIDIKPGSDPNCFNINGHGVIPVAILGSDAFDVSTIDLYEPLRFAGLSVRAKGNSQLQCSFDDVSGDFTNPKGEPDGFPDLVCHFADDTDLWTSGNGTATLTGTLTDCTSFEGADEICVVP